MGKKAQRRRAEKNETRWAARPALSLAPPVPAGSVVHVTDATFEREVLEHDTPVLVDFWAPWCGPCKMIAPVLEELAKTFEGRLRVAKIDTERNQRVPERYQIRSIPTLILFRDGGMVAQRVGSSPKATLERWLESHLGRPAGEVGTPAEAGERPGIIRRLFG